MHPLHRSQERNNAGTEVSRVIILMQSGKHIALIGNMSIGILEDKNQIVT